MNDPAGLKNNFLYVSESMFFHQLQVGTRGVYLDADHFLRDVHHGVGQPALQALGKVADGLS